MTNRQAARSEKSCWLGFVSVPALECAHSIFRRRRFAVLEPGQHGTHLYFRENLHSARPYNQKTTPEAVQKHMQAFSDTKFPVESFSPPWVGAVLAMNYWVIAHFPLLLMSPGWPGTCALPFPFQPHPLTPRNVNNWERQPTLRMFGKVIWKSTIL